MSTILEANKPNILLNFDIQKDKTFERHRQDVIIYDIKRRISHDRRYNFSDKISTNKEIEMT